METPSNDNDGEEDDYDGYDDRDFHNDEDDDDDLENNDGYPRGKDDCSSLKKMRKSIKKLNRRKSRGGGTSENSRTNNNAKRKRGSTLCTLSEYKIFKVSKVWMEMERALIFNNFYITKHEQGRFVLHNSARTGVQYENRV